MIHDNKSFSFILVHTIYLLTVPLYQLINGTSHHQHNSITVYTYLSHYSRATHFNHITVILRLTISTKTYTYYGRTKLYVHWNAFSSPQVLHILLSFIGFVKKYSQKIFFFDAVCCTVKEVVCDMHVDRLRYFIGYCTIYFFKTGVLCLHTGTVKGQQPVTSHTAVLTVLTSNSLMSAGTLSPTLMCTISPGTRFRARNVSSCPSRKLKTNCVHDKKVIYIYIYIPCIYIYIYIYIYIQGVSRL